MTTTKLCRCDHPADYHATDAAGRWHCIGKRRIHEAHPDYEPCDCTAYRPKPGDQGRML